MKKIYLLIGLCLLIFASCRKNDPLEIELSNKAENLNADVAQKWYQLTLQLIKNGKGFTPPIAARALGYTGITLYQSILPGLPNHHSLSGQLNGLKINATADTKGEYNWNLSANAALALIVKNLFENANAAQKSSIDSLENAIKAIISATVNPDVTTRSIGFGQSVGSEIFEWSKTDGGHMAYNNLFPEYTAPTGDGMWEPTAMGYSKAMLPTWGNNRLMVTSGSSIQVPAPPVYSTDTAAVSYKQALAVYNKSKVLTQNEKDIAFFWADDPGTLTPPGHNIAIALQFIEQKQLKLDKAAILLAQGGIALNDAAIICWKCKYKYSYLRPISFIRKNIDPNWSPLIPTPPFPSYTSGHATFSNSMAEILTANFGDNIQFTDEINNKYGFKSRTFNSFYKAAEEAANSRFYAGIHYQFDNDEGKACGKQIGKGVVALKW